MRFETQKAFGEFGILQLNSGAYESDHGWQAPDAASSFGVTDPVRGNEIARVSAATARDLEAIISCSERCQRTWRTVPPPRRGQLIGRVGELVATHREAISALVSSETGKSIMEARSEINEVIDMATLAAGQARMLYGFTQQSQRVRHRMYEQWLPLGVAGVISAYNFPAAVWAQNGFLSAICGNTVIWKPSPRVPLTAVAIQKLTIRAMEALGHPGVFSLFIPRDDRVAELLVRDARISLLSFTGSTKVGRHIAAIVATQPGRRCLLECSGNNACIIDETADLKLAARSIAFSAVGTTGQRCTSTRRIIVHRSIRRQFLDLLSVAYAQIKVGDPRDETTLVGPLIDPNAVIDFEKTIEEAKAQGGRVISGGRRIEGPGFFVEPTIIDECRPDWPCVQRETFAPILFVIEYETLDEAIEIHNGVAQGLASGIHSTNINNIEHFLSADGSDCGIAKVNMGTTGADVGAAFGGEKETGGGRTAGSDAWKGYMRRQSVCINWSRQSPWDELISFNE